MMAGDAVGVIVLPLFVSALNSEYGWQGTMLVFSGISLNVIPCITLIKYAPLKPYTLNTDMTDPLLDYSTIEHTCQEEKSGCASFIPEIHWRRKVWIGFILHVTCVASLDFVLTGFNTYMPELALSLGYSQVKGALLLSTEGAVGIFVLIFIAAISDYIPTSRSLFSGIGCLALALLLFVATYANTITMLVVLSVFLGIAIGK